MTITHSRAADRAKFEIYLGRRVEFWLLLLVSIVMTAGMWLVLLAQSYRAEISEPAGKPLKLNEVRSSADLMPLLGFFDNPQERSFAASRILAFIQDRERLNSVNELQSIRVSRRQIDRTGGLSSFVERLRQRHTDRGEGSVSIPLLTPAQVRHLRPLLSVRGVGEFSRLAAIYGAVFIFAFWALHAAWRVRSFRGDQLLLPLVFFLSGMGFLMMIRLRDPLRDSLLFPDFAAGAGIGCLVAFLASLPDYEESPLKRLAYVPLLLSFALSTILILAGYGPGLSDARINLRIGPVQFQPVELIKLLLVFFLAGFFANRWEFLRELKQLPSTMPGFLRGLEIPKLRYAAPLVIAVGVAILFFFLEKDLGPALVMLLLFLLLYAIARSRATGALISCAALLTAICVGYKLNFPHTVAARLSMWLSPWDNYVRPGGDHLAQSLWTFSAGSLFGTGLGLGDPGAVPAVHTDLILAAVGEELGFVGLACVWIAYAVLVHRAFRISIRSRGAYSLFLGIAAALLIVLQVAFISAGILGLVPLSGVVTPFINYGKSSAVSNFFLIGVLTSLSRSREYRGQNELFRKQLSYVGGLLTAIAIILLVQAARIQIIQADQFLGRGALITQADGHRRYTYNPRILEAMRSISRGSIFDRNGLPLATDSKRLVESYRDQYSRMHINIDEVINSRAERVYPFGGLTFHLLGDLPSRLNWGAPNSSYVERDLNTTLQGYDDRAVVVRVRDQPGGPEHLTIRRDLRDLVPLVRYRYRPGQKKVQEILNRNRDVRLTIDARLQSKVAELLKKRIVSSGMHNGAAVVTDPATGSLLASVSYPWPDVLKAKNVSSDRDEIPEHSELANTLLDRPRYGLYPPGSSFKLVTSIAALESKPDVEALRFDCRRLPDGRVGNYVRGWGRPIRDDVRDKEPHGSVDLAKGLILSCNAYFAQLGTYVIGAENLMHAAEIFGIRAASPNMPAQLRESLPQASYGQAQVLVTPLQMARVAGAIGNEGRAVPVSILRNMAGPQFKTCISAEQASRLALYMRRAVTEGTGREAAKSVMPIAGKTGTAELRNAPAHAWFEGFAPYGFGIKKIAFSVLIENGRYGGSMAAPLAAEIVDAAAELKIIGREQ
jgi:cell division protein FtsI/penicillin-binding protein 2/cell division protein FtsW (lipid II flippase)